LCINELPRPCAHRNSSAPKADGVKMIPRLSALGY
jgi:hypothetical protein